jgi:XTP/dITP diphosphohydrolase
LKIVLASKNKGKRREFENFLKALNIKVIPFEKDIEERGLTFFENACLKAKISFEETKIPSAGEDSGLVVDCLYGMPGVFSNRFHEKGNDRKNRKRLLDILKGRPFNERKARFVSCIVLFTSSDKYFVFNGEVEGFIDFEEKGTQGFGYDPIFLYPQLGKTFGQLPLEIKNRISHRAKALMELKKFLIKNESSFS